MSEVVRQVSENLVKKGHIVVIATSINENRKKKLINGVEVVEFDIRGNSVLGFTGEVRRYEEFILNSKFDVITNFAAKQWASDLVFPILNKLSCIKVFVPTGYSALINPEYQDYFHKMEIYLKDYDKVVYHSSCFQDLHFAQSHGINNAVIIPNGASLGEFCSDDYGDIREILRIPKKDFLVLHVSGYVGGKRPQGHNKYFPSIEYR